MIPCKRPHDYTHKFPVLTFFDYDYQFHRSKYYCHNTPSSPEEEIAKGYQS